MQVHLAAGLTGSGLNLPAVPPHVTNGNLYPAQRSARPRHGFTGSLLNFCPVLRCDRPDPSCIYQKGQPRWPKPLARL